MTSVLISFLSMLRGVARSRAALHLEVLALRHQLQVLQRSRPRRLRLATMDRWLWAWLARSWSEWRTALVIVKPDGHRLASQGLSPIMDLEKSAARRATARPARSLDAHSNDVARQPVVGSATASWRALEVGRRRVSGHGLEVHGTSEYTALAVLAHVPDKPPPANRRRRFPRRPNGDLSALVRAGNPRARTPPDRPRRRHRLSHGGVDRAATARSFPWNEAPQYLVHDRDSAFYAWTTTAAALGIEEILTAPRSPWQNASAEWLIGSIRRECLDHIIVANERGLHRALHAYVAYYLKCRTHLSLEKDAPVSRLVTTPTDGAIVAIPHLGGLHHHYERRAA